MAMKRVPAAQPANTFTPITKTKESNIAPPAPSSNTPPPPVSSPSSSQPDQHAVVPGYENLSYGTIKCSVCNSYCSRKNGISVARRCATCRLFSICDKCVAKRGGVIPHGCSAGRKVHAQVGDAGTTVASGPGIHVMARSLPSSSSVSGQRAQEVGNEKMDATADVTAVKRGYQESGIQDDEKETAAGDTKGSSRKRKRQTKYKTQSSDTRRKHQPQSEQSIVQQEGQKSQVGTIHGNSGEAAQIHGLYCAVSLPGGH